MPRWSARSLATAALVMLMGGLDPSPVVTVASPPGTIAPPPTTTIASRRWRVPASIVDNEFMPENRDLTECISAVPEPGCGSNARGGWRQGAVFAVIVAGLSVIGWRIVRSVRHNQPDRADPP